MTDQGPGESIADQTAALRAEIVAEVNDGTLSAPGLGEEASDGREPPDTREPAAPSDSDDDAGDSGEGDSEAAKDAEKPKGDDSDEEGEGTDTDEDSDEDDDADGGEFDLEKAQELGKAGDVDALCALLGLPEGTLPGKKAHKALRIERRKAQKANEKAESLHKQMIETYSDPVVARRALEEHGDVEPLLGHLSKVANMDWNELNKLVLDSMQGKTPEELQQKRRLRQLEREAEARKKEDEKAAKSKDHAAKVESAKEWIKDEISDDPLAKDPDTVDLVYEKLQKNWARGVQDPKKALEMVRGDLQKEAKRLKRLGIIEAKKAKKRDEEKTEKAAKEEAKAKGRKQAQAGIQDPEKTKPMTAAEVRKQVLQEEGLWREGMS